MAVSAVFLQSILSFVLNAHLDVNTQVGIGVAYNLVKFSAPAFIFSILFTNTKYTLGPNFSIKKFIFCLIIILAAAWLIFYDCLIFHGSKMREWYLFDGFFMSFALYGFLGVLCAIFFEFYCDFLLKWEYLIERIKKIASRLARKKSG